MAIIRDFAYFFIVYNSGDSTTPNYIAVDCGCYTDLSLGEASADAIEWTCRNTGVTNSVSGAISFSDATITFVLDDVVKDGYDIIKEAKAKIGDADATYVLLYNKDKTSTLTVDSTTGAITYPTDRNAVTFTGKIGFFNLVSNGDGGPLQMTITINQSSESEVIKRTAA